MENRDVAKLSTSNRRQDEVLGTNSDIGRKLRALYGAVEQEEIPPSMLDLLYRLDKAEVSSSGPELNKGTAS